MPEPLEPWQRAYLFVLNDFIAFIIVIIIGLLNSSSNWKLLKLFLSQLTSWMVNLEWKILCANQSQMTSEFSVHIKYILFFRSFMRFNVPLTVTVREEWMNLGTVETTITRKQNHPWDILFNLFKPPAEQNATHNG